MFDIIGELTRVKRWTTNSNTIGSISASQLNTVIDEWEGGLGEPPVQWEKAGEPP